MINFGTTSGNISVIDSNACGASTASTLAITLCHLANWHYSQPVTIANTSDSNLTNYQVKLIIPYASGKMNSDFSDLRFTDGSCTFLNYWIDSFGTSSSARVWVKVPSIPTIGTTIYMYYGNNAATSLSSGPNTFLLFDDFETGTSINPSLWTSQGTLTISGGTLYIGNTSSYQSCSLYSIALFGPGSAFYSHGTLHQETGGYVANGFGGSSGPVFYRRWTDPYITADNGCTVLNGCSTSIQTGYTTPTTAAWEIDWKPDGTANFYVDGNYIANPGSYTSTGKVEIDQYSPGQTTTDLVYVRSFVATEPVASFGAEQSCP